MKYDDTALALASEAKAASRLLSTASTATKNAVLHAVADGLIENQAALLAANVEDLARAEDNGLSAALIDRLRLTPERLENLAGAVRQVAALPDPVGRIDALETQSNGMQVGRMHVPLGVVLIVYESRPNVTIDAAALCLKAGNAVILRGGKEARSSNLALANVLRTALKAHGLPEQSATFVEEPDREFLYALLGCSGKIDLAIPRGGTSLIDAVNEHARVPVIQHYQGICHVYVHGAANLQMAERITVNAKVQRPGVCNAMECVLVDQAVAETFVPAVIQALAAHGVEVRGCAKANAVYQHDALILASEIDFDTEFLGLTCALKVVEDQDDATAFIAAHGSGHTASIVTNDYQASMRFLREIDASCVMINASTRFNDGGELGLGAELGISTSKLHAYGPMGLEELCTRKFVVMGQGQTRGSPP